MPSVVTSPSPMAKLRKVERKTKNLVSFFAEKRCLAMFSGQYY